MIGFYHENEAFGCFSNWYPAAFDYAGQHYLNSEQFMMYHKVMMFRKYDFAQQIMQTDDPAKCKKIAGQSFPEFDSDLWNKTSFAIVKRGVKAKFAQNEDIREELLSTGNELLAECSPTDKKWGIGIDIKDSDRFIVSRWKGKNYLGRILMEVREELRQELLIAQDGILRYVDARELKLIQEWNLSAGELKRIPQYYNTIHAYGDTLKSDHERQAFYNDYSLNEWDIAMKTNMGGGLPIIGFYEMKQDVYDIANRLHGFDIVEQKRIEFCKKYIPQLKAIRESSERVFPTCDFERDAIESNILVRDYGFLVKDSIEEWVAEPTTEQLNKLDPLHIFACVTWHFRRDHFVEGTLESLSIREGHMLRMLQAYLEKVNEKSNIGIERQTM